jgi:hypothetical protein
MPRPKKSEDPRHLTKMRAVAMARRGKFRKKRFLEALVEENCDGHLIFCPSEEEPHIKPPGASQLESLRTNSSDEVFQGLHS